MKKIVAIGGGEIGRPGTKIETQKIDEEIIRLSGKKNPKLLFIPTASFDSEDYYKIIKKYFDKKLGCQTDVLYLIKERLTKKEIENKILNSDIIYVGGGQTSKMMRVWRKLEVDKILLKAYEKGIVLSGLSAGAICWFIFGNSDSRKFDNPKANLIRVRGLGIVRALFCPHYDVERERKADLKKMMRRNSGIAIAVENCCAIEIIDDKYKVLSSKNSANAYKVYWKNNKFHEEIIEKEKDLKPLKNILKQ